MSKEQMLIGQARDERTPAPTAPSLVFDELFDEHFDFVWWNLRRLGVPEAQVDDALQDVFVAVHRHLADFKTGSLKGWLFGFVMRVAATHRRSERNSGKLKEHTERAQTPEAAAPPDAELQAREARDLLHRLLAELSEERRIVFVLAQLEELTLPEVAETLGINLNTAYSRLRDARRELEDAARRERLREDWRTRWSR